MPLVSSLPFFFCFRFVKTQFWGKAAHVPISQVWEKIIIITITTKNGQDMHKNKMKSKRCSDGDVHKEQQLGFESRGGGRRGGGGGRRRRKWAGLRGGSVPVVARTGPGAGPGLNPWWWMRPALLC